MTYSDPLCEILEKHLYTSLLEEETTEHLVYRVVADYIELLLKTAMMPINVAETVENDLRDEVKEMLMKKTYGYFSLSDFRKAQQNKTPEKDPRRMT